MKLSREGALALSALVKGRRSWEVENKAIVALHDKEARLSLTKSSYIHRHVH